MTQPSDKSRPFALNWPKVIRRISIIIGIGILVSVAVPALTSKPIDPGTLLDYHPAFLLLALVMGLIPTFLHAWTVQLWSDYFKKGLNFRDGISITATSLLGSAVTPTVLGGAPVKMGLLMLYRFSSGQAAAVTSIGSLQDIVAFGAIILLSVFLSEQAGPEVLLNKLRSLSLDTSSVLLILAGIVIVCTAAYFLLTRSSAGKRIILAVRRGVRDFFQSYKMISQDGKGLFFLTSVINIIRWASMYFILLFLFAALRLPDADYLEIWSLQWIVFTGMTVTPLPGGAGGAEAVFYMVYNHMVPENLIFGLILVWRFFSAYLRLIFAAVLVIIFPLETERMETGQ